MMWNEYNGNMQDLVFDLVENNDKYKVKISSGGVLGQKGHGQDY